MYVEELEALCRCSWAAGGLLFAAGEPLLARAQHAGTVRSDTNLAEIIQMVGGIAKIPGAEPEAIAHMLQIALDGLRRRP